MAKRATNDLYFLRTKHLGLRSWTLDDIDQAIQLWGNADVMQYVGGPLSDTKVYGRLLTERAIQRQHDFQYWPVFLLKTGAFIGCCGLRPYMRSSTIYELGVLLLPQYWRQGYATEACKAVIRYALDELQAASILATHHPDQNVVRDMLLQLKFKYAYDELFEPAGLPYPCYILPGRRR